MRIEIMQKGDKVFAVTEKFIAIKRKNGEVDIIPLIGEELTWRVDTENVITIGYGENVVSVENENGVTIYNF